MKPIFLLPALLLLASCAAPEQRELKNEHLLMQLPIPGGDWQMTAGRDAAGRYSTWTQEGERLRLTISTTRAPPSPQTIRTGMEETTRTRLTSKLRSQVLQQDLVNGYSRALWQTQTTLKEGGAVNLLLYIQGREAGYLFDKRWNRAEVSAAELKVWQDYFTSISVCDDTDPRHPCPEMQKARAIR